MLGLIVGDTHFTGKNPIARLDDLVELQFDKWDEIISIANTYDCSIIHTGDIFNVSIIANSILTRIGSALEKLKHTLYFVWGNHDLLYHSLDLWDRTSLGVLWKNNNKVKHIAQLPGWAWLDWEGDGIQWMGEPKQKILLTHKAVVSERKMGKGSWVLEDKDFCINIDDHDLGINLTKYYKLIICGHWHKPYRFMHEGTLVINPGPVLRRSIEDWLMPSVVLINFDTLLYKRIYLKSAQPPNQVLSKKHIEQKVESYTEGVMKFVEQLQDKEIIDKASFLENLFELLDSHQLPKNVENILRNIISNLIEKGAIDGSL